MKMIFVGMGSLFAVIGFILLAVGAAGSKAMKKSRGVNAKIVDFVVKTYRRSNRHLTKTYCYPIYEYYDGGEVKQYTSSVSELPKKPIGTEVTLYISEDGKIREKSVSKVMYLVGGIFAAIGVFFAVIGLFFLKYI